MTDERPVEDASWTAGSLTPALLAPDDSIYSEAR